ncbi:hypothetical protein SORBI_3005G172000 [Sorghum bicolor]|uniref:Uncharacterized protein n=1 Tax=Sorghum bicolor TaxID=4558 RepID=A0A1B6PT28_SORBI|nr:hypothetical protein SORBI_3005G172000 [Sorghum bicolor]
MNGSYWTPPSRLVTACWAPSGHPLEDGSVLQGSGVGSRAADEEIARTVLFVQLPIAFVACAWQSATMPHLCWASLVPSCCVLIFYFQA